MSSGIATTEAAPVMLSGTEAAVLCGLILECIFGRTEKGYAFGGEQWAALSSALKKLDLPARADAGYGECEACSAPGSFRFELAIGAGPLAYLVRRGDRVVCAACAARKV